MAEQTLTELLKQFSPFDQLPEDLLARLAQHVQVKTCDNGSLLFRQGDNDPDEIYLIQGQVKLIAKDGRESYINAQEEKASYPLAHLRPRMYSATSSSNLTYFTIGKPVVDLLQARLADRKNDVTIREMQADAGNNGQSLLFEFQQELNNGRFIMPSLPEIALKVRQYADDPDCELPELAKYINTDPAIAAKLLRTANSALYRGVSPYKDTLSAISRLGLNTTKQLVTSFAVLSVFQPESEDFRQQMHQLWEHCVEVAAYSYVLAKQLPTLNEEEALLAGLLHLIGEQSILLYASRFYDLSTNERKLHSVRMQLRGKIGSMVMEKWHFPEEMVTVAREFDNWMRNASTEFDYCDLIQVAIIYASQNNHPDSKLPNIQSIPAFEKLALSQQQTTEIISEAQDQIEEIRGWFR